MVKERPRPASSAEVYIYIVNIELVILLILYIIYKLTMFKKLQQVYVKIGYNVDTKNDYPRPALGDRPRSPLMKYERSQSAME